MEITILAISSLVLIAILLYFRTRNSANGISKTDFERIQQEKEQLAINLAKAEERALYFRDELSKLKNELDSERSKLNEVMRDLEYSKSYLKAREEKIEEQKKEIVANQEKFNKDFELIATRILDEKTKKFTEENRNNLDIILNPLKENIKAFEDKVEKVYKAESDERNMLKGHINQLIEQSNLMNLETRNLTKALKGDSKKQGNWGEMILERVLERSGLVKDREYRIQTSLQSSDGNRLQPDVVSLIFPMINT